MEFLDNEFEEILNIFRMETEEIISRLNASLMELEKNPTNKDIITLLFRDAHSLKGAARMIGFNNVQTLAHKIEDILGLAREDKLTLTPNIADILYKTVDFLSVLINESIKNKKETYNADITYHLDILNSLVTHDNFSEVNFESADYDKDLLIENIEHINKGLIGAIVCLMRIEAESNQDLITNFLDIAKSLYDIFSQVNIFELKNSAENIKVKLDFVLNGSKILSSDEIVELQNDLNNIIMNLSYTCKMIDIEVPDYYTCAFDEMSVETKLNVVKVEDVLGEEKVNYPRFFSALDFDYIKDKIMTLKENFSALAEIRNYMSNYEKFNDNKIIIKIFSYIIKTLDFIESNNILLDDSAIEVIQNSINYCNNISKNLEVNVDIELIFQQLEIVQQLLELNRAREQSPDSSIAKISNDSKINDFNKIFETGEIKTLHVDSQKLDALVNQVGELIITKIKTTKHLGGLDLIKNDIEELHKDFQRAVNLIKSFDRKYYGQLNQEVGANATSKQILNNMFDMTNKLGKISTSLVNLQRISQEDNSKMRIMIDDMESMVKNIRVLPLATVFHLFGRMVRDIAKEKGKKIDLEIFGSDTSADKKIIEEIKTPLIHIIRNAIDHGIESPEHRLMLNKPEAGKISIHAKHLDNKIMIEVIDDGQGFNLGKIKEKAVHNGFLTEEEISSMSDEEIMNIIFWPGFTTGDEVTSISGRGIGLDVVKTKISQLNGKVRVISEVNRGSCVQIELPVTMATLKVFLVRSGNHIFAVPMSAIKTVVWKRKNEIYQTKDIQTIVFDGKTIPIYHLSQILNIGHDEKIKERETIIIVESDNKTAGLIVDKLMGDLDVLQKKLSPPLYRIKNISGMTNLASGEICFILNVVDLLKNALKMFGKGYFLPEVKTVSNNLIAMDYKRILIVDDSLTTITLEKNILKSAGYTVDYAFNVSEAKDKLKNNKFDLIVCDIEMPEVTGFEFVESIKNDEMYADIPVIFMSSNGTVEYRKRAEKLGVKDYIVKSQFDEKTYLSLVEKYISKGVG